MAINLKTEKRHGTTILYVQEKRLDAHNSVDLKRRINELVEGGECDLVIELGAVHFIDSSGLGILLSGHKIVSPKNGKFILTGLQPQVRSMFELTRLHRVFDIKASLEDALGGNN